MLAKLVTYNSQNYDGTLGSGLHDVLVPDHANNFNNNFLAVSAADHEECILIL